MELRANIFSRYTLHWIGYYLGLGTTIQEKDIPEITSERHANHLYGKICSNWEKELKKRYEKRIYNIKNIKRLAR